MKSVQLPSFSLSLCLLMLWRKKGGVINVTSMNISPEICQRCNEILFCDPEPEISVLGIQ